MMNKNKSDIFKVVKYGDPILRKKVNQVIDFTKLPLLVDKMFRTMYNENGIGLAANQVGISLNILVIDTASIEEELPQTISFLNSEIIESKGLITMEEGCLSVPDIRAEIERPETISLKYQDLQKQFHTSTFSGIAARVILHELDHLNGKFFTDYLSPIKKSIINKRLLEISKYGQPSTGIII